jgi:hypothetical protein
MAYCQLSDATIFAQTQPHPTSVLAGRVLVLWLMVCWQGCAWCGYVPLTTESNPRSFR